MRSRGGSVAQLNRASDYGSEGCGFESRRNHRKRGRKASFFSYNDDCNSIWYKEKKQRFSDERVDVWNDGVTAYMVYRKKKVVEIHDANSDKKDKYSGKFKFSLDDFDYSKSMDGEDLVLRLKQRRGAKGTVKEVRAYIDPKTLTPKFVKVKVSFIWTKIKISNFMAGFINDNMFVFPQDQYPSSEYKYVDKR